MRLGIVSDVHGNLPALDSVLRSDVDVEQWICLGDVVGYYPDASNVCARLQEIEAIVIAGNHDAYVTGLLAPASPNEDLTRTQWTRERLDDDCMSWLRNLPMDLEIKADDKLLRFRHASPWDLETYIYADSSSLSGIDIGYDEVLFLGHTHWPMKILVSQGIVANPGSVGQPRDYDPRPSFLVYDTSTGDFDFRRTKYDVVRYQLYLKKMGWASQSIEILSRLR